MADNKSKTSNSNRNDSTVPRHNHNNDGKKRHHFSVGDKDNNGKGQRRSFKGEQQQRTNGKRPRHKPGHSSGNNNNNNNKPRSNDKHNCIVATAPPPQQPPPPPPLEKNILWWHSPVPHLALEIEQDLLKVVLKWSRTERGMVKDQPLHRRRDIETKCRKLHLPISLACSLRRHHMSLLNPYKSKESLGLGDTRNIKEAADLFEQAIAAFLTRHQVEFWDENAQKQHFFRNNPGQLLKATPDFQMKEPLRLKKYTLQQNKSVSTRNIFEERTIHWLEAKMFYGASTVPLHDKKSAVGSILPKMKKYVELYGEGAIVFMQGCGEMLASELAKIGVMALCCTSQEFDLSEVLRQQRTWCADEKGNILP